VAASRASRVAESDPDGGLLPQGCPRTRRQFTAGNLKLSRGFITFQQVTRCSARTYGLKLPT